MSPSSPSITRVTLSLTALALALFGTTGCRAIEGIFKAGVWVGVLIVVALGLVAFGATRLFARG